MATTEGAPNPIEEARKRIQSALGETEKSLREVTLMLEPVSYTHLTLPTN